MKILLFGKNGLLGSEIVRQISSKFDLTALDHKDADVTKAQSVFDALAKAKPDFVVNATGYTNVDLAEKEHEKAFQINAHAVSILAKFCADRKIPIMHFSTDYVFEGTNPDGYREEDLPHPINTYGKSKEHGENLLMESTPYYFLIRSQWLYGHGGKNFVDTVLNLAKMEPPLRMVNDQFGKPTYVFDLVKAIIPFFQSKNYGIYHIVNEGVTNWYEFAKEILRIRGIEKEVTAITSEELSRPAKRPKYSALLNTKVPLLRPWKEALKDYLG